MLDTATKRRIDTARDILVGKVPDPKSQVEQITIALIYKFMDDMDAEAEELGGKRTFFTGKYSKYGWRKIFDARLSGFDMLSLYSEAIQQMNLIPTIPQLFRDIFKNAYLPYRDPETLKAFLKIINEFNYDHSERLGDAFEYLLSVLGSQGDAGQFRTPRHIIDFMVRIADPKKSDRILDPACGTSGFLISSYKHILKQNTHPSPPSPQKSHDPLSFSNEEGGRRPDEAGPGVRRKPGSSLTTDDRKKLAQQLKGYDISPDMVRLSLANMYLHGFTQPSIIEYDTLTSDDRWNEYYDVIMANPPFMSPKGGIRPHKRFSVQSNRSEVLFVDYIAEHLTPNGRAAVIVPEGIIFQSGTAYKALRKLLVENYLWAVVSLPAGVFQPYSGVKTSVLLLDKTLAKKTGSILFVKVQNDGFDLGAQRRPIDKSDLYFAEELLKHYKQQLQLENFDVAEAIKDAAAINKVDHEVNDVPLVKIEASQYLLVEKKKIAAGDYGLSGDRYKENGILKQSNFPLVEIGEICNLINGRAFKPEDWEQKEQGGLPIIRIQNLNDSSANFNYYSKEVVEKVIVNHGDLLFSWSGSRGTSFGAHIWYGRRAILNQHIFRIEHKDVALRKYLLYALNKAVEEVEQNLHGGVGLVHITKGNLERITIPLPPLSIQQQIVTEIEGYQKVIDGARQVVENYKPTIRIHPDWEMVELGEVCEKINEIMEPQEEKGLVKYVGLENVDQGNGKIIGEVITNYEEIKSSKFIFKANNILYGKLRPNLNKVWLSDFEGICSTDFFVLQCKKEIAIEKYFAFYFLSEKFNKEVLQGISGAQLPRVNFEYFSSIQIPLPPLEEQEEIVRQLEMERLLVVGNKQLIARMEQKIKETIAQVWGENKSGVVYEMNEVVSMVAEE